MKDKHIVHVLVIIVLTFLLIAFLLSSCSVAYDFKYSLNNWQTDTVQPVYYVDVVEVYKPSKMKVINKSDSIRTGQLK